MITSLLYKGLITSAFDQLEDGCKKYPGEEFADKLDAMRTEFGYMSDYMMKGYKDEKRKELFLDLLQRMRGLDYDLKIRATLKENPMLKMIDKTGGRTYVTASDALNGMENAPDIKAYFLANEFSFYSLLTSGWWSRRDSDEWSAMLLSLDSLYAAPLVAALGLSAMTNFCVNKVRCLVCVYRAATDEKLRQRALVGAILAMSRLGKEQDKPEEVTKEESEVLSELLEVPGTAAEIVNLQMQLMACANAENDAKEISKNIMPDLVKNQPFRLTKDGFVEKDEENDCLDPSADERKMDAVKAGVDKMVSMQKSGSDIFFSGFSAMKRFPFFVSLRNWFIPFTMEHPAISEDMKLLGNSNFVKRIMDGGPFCDSDKYSFVLGYSSVYKQMPDEVKKLVESGEVGPIGMDIAKTQPTSAFFRLQYLQDMYRFFKLNTVARELYNPFDHVEEYASCVAICHALNDDERRTVVSVMFEDKKMWSKDCGMTLDPLNVLLESFDEKEGYWACRYRAEKSMRLGNYDDAVAEYTKSLKRKPEDPAAMRGMARACYAEQEYAKAAFYYDALHTLFPNRKSYVLNYVVSMVKDGMAEAVLNDIYKLEYEDPSSVAISNTLGWVLLNAEKAQQAVDVYEKVLLNEENYKDYDVVLNAFYAYLAMGKVQRALDVMTTHSKIIGKTQSKEIVAKLQQSMDEDTAMLEHYGIGRAERGILLSKLEVEL